MATIFLVEDNHELRENTRRSLQLSGHDVESFPDGMSAIKRFEQGWPDLILCDVMMPGMDGHEVLKNVRQMPGGASVPFIFLTALAERGDVRKGMEYGADDYLTKPFTIAELFAAVDSRLRSRALLEAEAEEDRREYHGLQLRVLPHEFRTPLNGILGGLSLLKEEFGYLGENFHEYVGLVEDAANRINRTLLNYIFYTQMASGKFRAPKASAVAVGVTFRSAALIEADTWGRRADLDVAAMDATWSMAQEVLDIVAREIISNAFKFSPAGSAVRMYMEGNDRVIVEDGGRGMTAEEIAQVGPFKQFGRDKNEQQGLGLGLAICREMVKLGGPHIDLMPNENGGLRVILTRPSSDAALLYEV